MADLADLIQKLSFYQAGGKDPGTSNADQFNQGFDRVSSVISDVLAKKKAMLENQKLQNAEAPIGNAFGVPNAKDQASQNQAIAGVNSTRVSPNVYPQPQALGPNDPSTGQPPEASQPFTPPQQQPMVNSREDFMDKYKISPDTPMSSVPEAMKLAMMNGQIPIFINETTQQVSFDPNSVLLGYKPFAQLQPKQAATIAASQSAATAPQKFLTGDAAAAMGHGTKNTTIITPTQQGISPYADEKAREFIYSKLPSHAPTGTPDSQASQIQLAARQLKGLIATPGSYQRLGLAKGDVARMVLRAAPQEEVLKSAGFTDTLVQRFNVLKQRITSDPKAVDQPEIRKELYDLADELQRSSQPIIERSTNQLRRSYAGKLPADFDITVQEELGSKFPDIPFSDGLNKTSPKPGGVLRIDPQNNKAWVYPDGTYDEVIE